MKRIEPEVTALTRPCPLGGNFSLPRGVCFILAALHCNRWSGAACRVPLAQADKIIPRTCCVPDAFCRMSDLTEMGKGWQVGCGCTRKARMEEELPRPVPGEARSGAGMISSLSVGSTKPRDPLNPRTDYREEMRAELLSSFFVGMTKLTNTRAICHKTGFNVSLLQHDSTAETGTGVQLPALASHEE